MHILAAVIGVAATLAPVERHAPSFRNEAAFASMLTWSHKISKDEMRGTVTELAAIASSNTVDLLPPYDGGTKMILRILRLPQFAGTVAEYSVTIAIAPGQITCDRLLYGSDSCITSFKVDDGPVQKLGGQLDLGSMQYAVLTISGSSDPKVFGYSGAKEFVDQLRTAKSLTLEGSSYQSGTFQFKFDVSGFPITTSIR